MSLSNIEAKYELVSLLSYPKTVITNYFGGTIGTLSLGGFKRFKQALDLMKTEEFKKRIELEGIEPDFITSELNIIVDPIKTDYPKAYKEFKKIVSSKLSSKENLELVVNGKIDTTTKFKDDLYELLFGEKFANAHDAKADVEALANCYFELVKRGEI
jgi:hypothetical protein